MSNQNYDVSKNLQIVNPELHMFDEASKQVSESEVFNLKSVQEKGFKFSKEAMASLPLQDQILFEYFGSGPMVEAPYKAIHHAFEEQAKANPFSIAAMYQDEQITYTALNTQANRLAMRLEELGVVRGDNVGLFLQRSIPMLVGIMGTLKVGAAYVPQDARVAPMPVLEHIVEAAEIKVILTLSHLKDNVPDSDDVICICIDEFIGETIDESEAFVSMTQIHRNELVQKIIVLSCLRLEQQVSQMAYKLRIKMYAIFC